MTTLGQTARDKISGVTCRDEVRDSRPALEGARASLDALLGKLRVAA